MSDKSCRLCQHFRRERTGPHEWLAHCALHQQDFYNADHCGFYQPEPAGVSWNEENRWPFGEIWYE